MVEAGLVVTASASLLAALLFAAVAWILARRPYEPAVRLVGYAYALAWALFAIEAASDAGRVGGAAFGDPSLAAYLLLARVKIVAAGGAIFAFGYYVSYLWTGGHRWRIPLFALGLAHATLFLWLVAGYDPVGVEVGTWTTQLVQGGETGVPAALGIFVLVFFFLPPVVIAGFYLALVRRLAQGGQRFRVRAIALAILVFHATATVQFNPDTPPDAPWFPALVSLNVVAGVIALAAYRPPGWMARRFGLHDLAAEPAAGVGSP